MYKEGEECACIFIVKEGEIEIKKNVYESKVSDKRDYDLLHNPAITKKFQSNFQKVKGLKCTN